MRNDGQDHAIKPFMTRFATLRTGTDDQVGRYSEERDLWVVDTPEGETALITLGGQLGQTSTLTKVREEGDDTDISPVLGLMTETAITSETDDRTREAVSLGLITQTFVATEADDADPMAQGLNLGTDTRVREEVDDLDRAAMSLLAITTKTDAQQERDDHAAGLEMFEAACGVRVPAMSIR